MIEAFVKRSAMTVVFVAIFVVLGFFSYQRLVVEKNPKIDFPVVTVEVIYPGASPFDIESQVVKKIEDAVSEVSEIKKMNSTALESFGLVVIEFNLAADVNTKSIEIKDKVEAIINDLPAGIEKPLVSKFDPLNKPIVELVLSSDKLSQIELYELADKDIKNRFTTISGVASVDVQGGKERQINVNLDAKNMQRYYLTIDDVVQTIKKNNLNVPGGNITRSMDEINVRLQGEFSDVDALRNMDLVTAEGLSIKLRDIADVEDSFKKVEKISRYNGRKVVGLSVNKLSDGDAVSIAEKIRNMLAVENERLKGQAKVELAYDSTEAIVSDTNATVKNIAVGIVLTIVILLLFLGNFAITLISAIVIPTSIVSTFLLLDFSNFSINMMTLLALGTALGTLIANAIVIIESIMSELEAGKGSVDAAIDGTKKVTMAVIASAGTNLVVFTPIAFMGGIVGQFMKQFGMTVVYATIFSVIASFTLTPMLSALLLKPKNAKRSKLGKAVDDFGLLLTKPVNAMTDFALKELKIIFDLMFKRPFISLLVCFSFILSPMPIMKYIGSEFIAASDENVIRIQLELPQGTPIGQTQQIVSRVESRIKGTPEIVNMVSKLGENGPENASIIVRLVDQYERSKSDMELINEWTPKMADIADATISLERGSGSQADITINIYGDNYDELVKLSESAMKVMEQSGAFRTIKSSNKAPKDEIKFIPNEDKMSRYAVSKAQIGSVLRAAINGNDNNSYRENGEEYKINVTIAEPFKQKLQDISRLTVKTRGGLLPLSSFGDLSYDKSLPPLKRRDKLRIVELSGFLAKGTAGKIQKELTVNLDRIDFPIGYGYMFSGDAENMEESSREIGNAFFLAVVLTYMLLVAILNSYVHPLTIVSGIFTSFVGVFYALFFMDFSINIGSMMAMVMLVGLAVNNAILLLDETLIQLSKGVSIKEALWQSIELRFRPILMTSIAVVAGALPQVFDPSVTKASMGGVIIGGMLASVIFTFTLIPLVFYFVESARSYLQSFKS